MNEIEIVFIGWLAGMLTIASYYFLKWIWKTYKEILNGGNI